MYAEPMELAELIQNGWNDHESETARVADELEQNLELIEPGDPAGAAAFMSLVNHTIGDHGSDRARALRVCEAALARLEELGNREPWLQVAVARHLAGDEKGARKAESELGEAAVSQVRVRLLVAQGLVHAEQWSAALELYGPCIDVAESLPAKHGAEKAMAIVSNNIASALLRKPDRDEVQSKLMERAAGAARTFWLRVGDWTNSERADYLLASVHNALGRGREAREYARRGLKTIATNGEAKVDQAFLELALAQACKLCDEREEQSLAILRATALADEFGDEGLFNWFNDELMKAR